MLDQHRSDNAHTEAEPKWKQQIGMQHEKAKTVEYGWIVQNFRDRESDIANTTKQTPRETRPSVK